MDLKSAKGREALVAHQLRSLLKKDSMLLMVNPHEFFKKYPAHDAPLVVILQDIFQKYVDEGEIPGPLSRYHFDMALQPGLRVRVAFVDTERRSSRRVRSGSTVLSSPPTPNSVKSSRRLATSTGRSSTAVEPETERSGATSVCSNDLKRKRARPAPGPLLCSCYQL